MHIVRLKICGFREVRSADVALARHVALAGANNSGATTIIKALAQHADRASTPSAIDKPKSVNPREIFNSLPNAPGVNDLCASQAEVLDAWFPRRTDRVVNAGCAPDGAVLSERTRRAGYRAMQGMIFGDPPQFEAVLDSISALETRLNRNASESGAVR